MKVIICILLLQVIMTACQKKRFEECSDYNKLIGEWICIDNNEDNRILIRENGRIIFTYSLERDVKVKLLGCGFKDFYLSGYQYFKLDVKDGNYGLFISSTFDTILSGGGAYNNNIQNLENNFTSRRYVKK